MRSGCERALNELFIFLFADQLWNGVALLFEPGKVPEVGELAALLRFGGLHGAVIAFKKNALAIRFFSEG